MERVIGEGIDARQADIDAWLAANPPAGLTKTFNYSPGIGNLGEGYERLADGSVTRITIGLDKTRFVLKSDGNGGYIIQTAFPTR
jgi:hypothetical protein